MAEQHRRALNADIPVVAMGHLFTAGGKTVDGDGVRELYVGSLAHVVADIFPAGLDYLALGHLHVPQKVKGVETMRYSGSPLPMGFGEAKQEKSVGLVTFVGRSAGVQLIGVPVFQRLERIRGKWEEISAEIHELAATRSNAWLEVVYEGEEVIPNLRERLEEIISGSEMEMLRIANNRIIDQVLNRIQDGETLDDLNVHDVFARCLGIFDVPEEQRPELVRAYQEAVASLFDDDARAE